jgi:hypothetical protein
VGFEFLLYDVTSTYFEGLALRNAKAASGSFSAGAWIEGPKSEPCWSVN